MKGITLVAVSCSLLIASGIASAESRDSADRGMDHYFSSYAKDYKVSITEAKRRFAHLTEISKVQNAIAKAGDKSFGGLYVEHLPKFRVVVKFKDLSAKRLSSYTNNLMFVPELSDNSLIELTEVQNEVSNSLHQSGINFVSSIDIKTSRVNVGVPANFARAALLNKHTHSNQIVNFYETNGFIEPTIEMRAGSWLVGPEEKCTSGFSVTNGVKYGLLTAGHCDNQVKYSNIKALIFAGEMDSGSNDFQWHTGGQYDYFRPLMYNGTHQVVTIKGAMQNSSLPVGFYVCKYGVTTQLTCGDIADKSSQSVYKNVVATYVRVHHQLNHTLTLKGDSGGPVYVMQSAVGVVHGRGADGSAYENDLFYMPIDNIASLGLSVVTQP